MEFPRYVPSIGELRIGDVDSLNISRIVVYINII